MRSHRTDLVSFIPGAIFVALAVIALVDRFTIDAIDARWVWPALLVLLGVGILASTGRGARTDEPGTDAPRPDPVEGTWPSATDTEEESASGA